MRLLVLLAFFGSGLSGLILENLWVRMLTLVFGGTTLAIVTVLTAFMGGLAIGSYLAGKWADRLRRPILVYGLLESGIALYSLFLPFLIEHLPLVYRIIPLEWPFAVTGFFRFVLCVLLLLLPTTLMGATLPVLSRYFVRRSEDIGFDVGVLYSTNTFGAVAGALSGGFFFLPMFGHQQTLWIVTAILLTLSVAMSIIGAKVPALAIEAERPKQASAGLSQTALNTGDRMRYAVMLCLGITGTLAMICQVIWSRAISLVIGSSSYAFTLILGVFLIGLAMGAGWGAWIAKASSNLLRSWALLLFATAFSIALGSAVMDRLPVFFTYVAVQITDKADPLLLFSIKAFFAAVPIFVPTLLMGTFFPLGLAVYTQKGDPIGQNVGKVYAASTIGSIIGSAIAGFVIIPLFGLQGGLALCVSLYLLCAWWISVFQEGPRRFLLPAAALLVGAAVWLLPSWHHGRMVLGMFRLSLTESSQVEELVKPGKILFYKEGVSATVSVSSEEDSDHIALKVNGKADASSEGDKSTQIGLAALPLMIHPAPQDVAIIGWGSGMTVGAALRFPVRQVSAIELEPAVVEASRFFDRWNFQPLKEKDKRLRLFYNDGRNFLATAKESFDVIISEPSNPWMSGVANLFTVEFFQTVQRHLKPRGIFCQWVQIYELSQDNIHLILRSLRQVFPYVRVFELDTDNSDTAVIASMHPIDIDLFRAEKILEEPRLREIFTQMKIHHAYDWLPLFLTGEGYLDTLLKKGPQRVNTDAYNSLEFSAPLDLLRHASSSASVDFQAAARKGQSDLPRYFRYKGKPLHEALPKEGLSMLVSAYLRLNRVKEAKLLLQALTSGKKKARSKEAQRLVDLMDGEEGAPDVEPPQDASASASKKGPWRTFLKGKKEYDDDDYAACVDAFSVFFKAPTPAYTDFLKETPAVWFYLGDCSRLGENYPEALNFYQKFVEAEAKAEAASEDPPTSRAATSKPALSKPATSQPLSTPTSLPSSRPTP